MNLPIVALIISNIIWGAASPIFKYSLHNIPPFTLAFIRFFFASFILLPYYLRHRQKMHRKDYIYLILSAFFGITINISFFFLGLQKAPSINAPIIASSAPVFLFILSIFFLKEKPKTRVFAGMFISLIGVLIIILSPVFIDGMSLIVGAVQGNLLFVVATFGSVLKPLFVRKGLRTINAYQVTFGEFLFGALTFLPFMLFELKDWSFYELNSQGWVGIIFGVFFSSALAYFLFNWGVAKMQAQEVGIFYYIDPVVALLIAIPLLGEFPTIYYLVGSIFVFAGIFVAERRLHYHPIHKVRTR